MKKFILMLALFAVLAPTMATASIPTPFFPPNPWEEEDPPPPNSPHPPPAPPCALTPPYTCAV